MEEKEFREEVKSRLARIETTQSFFRERIVKLENDVEHLRSAVEAIRTNLKWIIALILAVLGSIYGIKIVI